MRLLTHNMLVCNRKECSGDKGFPLKIEATEVSRTTSDPNPELMRRMLGRLEWAALVEAAASLQLACPVQLPDNALEDEAFLASLQNVLMDVAVEEGRLVCPNCGREFPIEKGTPNMLLTESEEQE